MRNTTFRLVLLVSALLLLLPACTGDVGTTCFKDDQCNGTLECCHVGSNFTQGSCQTTEICELLRGQEDAGVVDDGGTGGVAGMGGAGGMSGAGGAAGEGGTGGAAGEGGAGGVAGAGGTAGAGGAGGTSGAGGGV